MTQPAMTGSSNVPTTYLNMNIFGTNRKVPQWVPVTLLAISSTALVVPIVMLRRYRRGIITQEVRVPRRRTRERSVAAPFFHPPPVRSHPTLQARPIQTDPPPLAGPVLNYVADDQYFNAPLYTLKAFGIATVLVALGATVSIWGVMETLNARNINEFAGRMRHAVTTKLPVLSHRIYRPAEPDPHGHDVYPQTENSEFEPASEWNWQEAENRLREAFDKDGFHGWASVALKEVEAEATAERARRGVRKEDWTSE